MSGEVRWPWFEVHTKQTTVEAATGHRSGTAITERIAAPGIAAITRWLGTQYGERQRDPSDPPNTARRGRWVFATERDGERVVTEVIATRIDWRDPYQPNTPSFAEKVPA